MLAADDGVSLCGDDALSYLASRTQFEPGQRFEFDEAYRLAHLPLVAPDHPLVISGRAARHYEMGRHGAVFSLVLPVPDALLRESPAYATLEAELRASPLASKVAWEIVERRRHKLHATLCGSLPVTALDSSQRDTLRGIGPVTVELRGLFSGNVNHGRLYIRAYPEKREGLNVFHRIQQAMGRRLTGLYVVGIYNLVDGLDAAESMILADIIERWWNRPVVRFQAETLWLLRSHDDLALDSEVVEIVSLAGEQ